MRTLVVGDVHGCADELAKLVEQAKPTRVVLVGDLFTKGPDPVGVWRQIHQGGFQAVLGNHDARVLEAWDDPLTTDKSAARVVHELEAEAPEALPWTRALPLFREVAGFTVVHAGLHPSGDLARTTRQMAITMRRWPEEGEGNKRWTAVYEGERRVIYGHDAVRGLVRIRRGQQTWLLGIDTGCVYGRQLTGYIVEKDELLHVPAARVYNPVKGLTPGMGSF
jgi:hypothetical protein